MTYLYILLTIIILFMVFNRRFDFLSFSAVTYCLYTINCAFGETWITGGSTGIYYQATISNKAYFAVLLQMTIIICVLVADKCRVRFNLIRSSARQSNDAVQFSDEITKNKHRLFWVFVMTFSYIVEFYNIFFRIGLSDFFSYTSKSILQENVSMLWGLAVWGTVLVFIYSVRYEDKIMLFFSFFLLLVPLFLGSRAYVATAIVGAISIKAGNNRNVIRNNVKIIIIGVLAIIFLSMYKKIYMAFRALDFNIVIATLKKGIVLPKLNDSAEFRTVFSLYNYVVDTGFRLPFSDTIARILSIIPLINNYIPTKYNIRLSVIIETLFIRSSYGLGGTFWGESVAMGGYVFLIIASVIWLVLIQKANKYIGRRSDSSIFVLSIASYCAFYIHRLDWVQVMGCIKSVLIFYLFYILISRLKFHVNVHVKSTHRSTLKSMFNL